VHYLEAGAAAGCDPHPLFDSAWYLWEYPDARRPNEATPLIHFVKRAAEENLYPTPLFDTTTYTRSQGSGLSAKMALRHFWVRQEDSAPGAYRSYSALANVQRRARDRTSMQLIRDRRSDPRRFGVFLQFGSGAIKDQWFDDPGRSWDLIINHYDNTYRGAIPSDVEFHQMGELGGTKFTALATLFHQWPELLTEYDYCLLLDDDIAIDAGDIDKLFRTAADARLDLAQASLSKESYATYDVFRHQGARGLRRVRGVEIMMPLLSRRALQIASSLFVETVSGWGLDYALSDLVSRVGDGPAAIIDDVVAKHLKKIDFAEGAYYKMLRAAGIHPEIELRYLRWKYRLDWWDFAMP